MTRSQTLSRLELLPTEIFVDILRSSSPASVLALKLTSRSILHKTKKRDGTEVVSIDAVLQTARECDRRLHEWDDKWWTSNSSPTEADIEAHKTDEVNWPVHKKILEDYLAMRICCETDTPRSLLTRLTCSGCGIAKTNGIAGFADCHFKKTRLDRSCIRCVAHSYRHSSEQRVTRMRACGKKIFHCFMCNGFNYECSRAAETVAAALVNRTTQYAQGSIGNWFYQQACQSCTDKLVLLCSGPQPKNLNEARSLIESRFPV